MKREDLTIGQYYVGFWYIGGGLHEIIFRFEGSLEFNKHYIDSAGEYREGSCCTATEIQFRKATFQEAEWLYDCMIAGKTVSKPSKIIEHYEIY